MIAGKIEDFEDQDNDFGLKKVGKLAKIIFFSNNITEILRKSST